MERIRECYPEKVTFGNLGRARWAESAAQRRGACEQRGSSAWASTSLPSWSLSRGSVPVTAEAALPAQRWSPLGQGQPLPAVVLCPWPSQALSFFPIFMPSHGPFPLLAGPFPGSSTWETLSGSRKSVSPPSGLLMARELAALPTGPAANSRFPWFSHQTSLNQDGQVPRCSKRGYSLRCSHQGLALGRKPGQFSKFVS